MRPVQVSSVLLAHLLDTYTGEGNTTRGAKRVKHGQESRQEVSTEATGIETSRDGGVDPKRTAKEEKERVEKLWNIWRCEPKI